MKVVINDACILTALCALDMGDALRDAGIALHTPAAVYRQLTSAGRAKLGNLLYEGVLQVHAASGLQECAPAGLGLAAQLGADLMSAQECVCIAAAAQGISCRGMFWLFDQAVRARCMDFSEACLRIKRMMAVDNKEAWGSQLFSEQDMRLIYWVVGV